MLSFPVRFSKIQMVQMAPSMNYTASGAVRTCISNLSKQELCQEAFLAWRTTEGVVKAQLKCLWQCLFRQTRNSVILAVRKASLKHHLGYFWHYPFSNGLSQHITGVIIRFNTHFLQKLLSAQIQADSNKTLMQAPERENPSSISFNASQKECLFHVQTEITQFYKADRKFKRNHIPFKRGLPRKRCATVRNTTLNEFTAFKNACAFLIFKFRSIGLFIF